MGGKTSKSTQAISIPPEVLARYNAVNARAEQTAGVPFQTYSYDPSAFVAPMTPTQLVGMQNINYASGQAQPYYQQATDQLMGGQMAAVPFYQQAAGNIQQGQQTGDVYENLALGSYYGGLAGATPYNLAAGQAFQNAGAAAYPLQMQAAQNIGAAQDVGSQLAAASLATQAGAGAGAAPIQGAALQNLAVGQAQGQGLTESALAELRAAQGASAPLYGLAGASILGAPGAAAPLQGSAADIIGGARAGTAPYQAISTALGLQGARAVSPTELDTAAINRYMSPYLQSVVAPTAALLNQQAQMAQAGQLGNAIRSGAFGGDRAGIAAANLQQQQALATGKVLGDLLQQGYGQALSTAQQQQATGLGAEQANRAAQAAAAQQLLGIGQTGFGQDISSAQAQAALAQQIFGQQLGAGQAAGSLAGQIFGQGATAAQQQQAAAQALFGQGATTAGQQAALAQQIFGQGMSQAQQQAALSSLLFGQGATAAERQAALGQQLFGQGITGGQAQQALAQQLFGQGLAGSQQAAALGQQAFGQDLSAAQAQQAIGQGLYGMGAGTSQALAGLGAGAQQAALQGGQAQMAAGQIQQQTQQAGLQALYNQFLQQVAYPFQVSQFLANIAMGTGALSGSTTTTTQPGSVFSDVRLKEDVRKVGETFDGQPIYSFRYKGDPKTQMGLLAQEVEQRKPEAVGLAGGLKTVNYDMATRDAAEMGKSMEGGRVAPHHAGMGYADGGLAGNLDADLQRQKMEEEDRRQKQAEEIKQKNEQATQKQGGLFPQKPDVPTTQNISSEQIKTPELPVAQGGLYGQDPRSQDASTIASIITAAAMMSDRRIKENIKHIGHTYDGQKIYSYNIKGEPATQIGLMADEVEKHHPEAVGRAGFADGGVPMMGGNDLAQLIAAQAQMYGPYAQFGRNMAGTPGGGGYVPEATLPVGSLVTAPGLAARPSSAEDLEKIYEVSRGAYNLYDKATSKKPLPPGGTTTTTTTPGSVSSQEPIDEEIEKAYRGGLMRAGGGPVLPYDSATERDYTPAFMKASGGPVIPYDAPIALAIPTTMSSSPELQTAGSLPAARSTMDDLKEIVDLGQKGYDAYTKMKAPKPEDLQEVQIKSKRVGQRADGGGLSPRGYQTGGSPFLPEPSEEDKLFRAAQGATLAQQNIRRLVEPKNSDTAITDPALQQRIAEAGEAALRPPAAPRPAPRPRPRPAAAAAAPAAAPAAPPAPGLGAAPMPEVPLEALREGAPAPGGLAAAPPVTQPGGVAAAPPATPPVAGGVAPPAAQPGAAEEKPGFLQRTRGFLQENKDLLFPLLSGAAAAAATPTENRISALLVGASGAARAYQDVQQRQAELEQTRAMTGQIGAQTSVLQAERAELIRKNQVVTEGGREFVVLRDGSRMLLGRYLSLSPQQRARVPLVGQGEVGRVLEGGPGAAPAAAPGAAGIEAAQGQTPGKSEAEVAEGMVRQAPISGAGQYLGTVGQQQIASDLEAFGGDNAEIRALRIKRNAEVLARVSDAGNAAYDLGANINALANYVAKLPDSGVAAAGVLSEGRRAFIKTVNDIIRTGAGIAGADPTPYLIAEKDIGTGDAIQKLTGAMSFTQTAGADQASLGALRAALEANPNMLLDKRSMETLLAQMMIDKQRALDLQNYMREGYAAASQTRQPENVSMENLVNSFRREQQFNDRAYTIRKQAVERLLQKKTKDGSSVFQWLRNKGYEPDRVDQYATFLLYGPKKDAQGNIVRDSRGDPVPAVPNITGISNIVNNQ